MQMVWLMTMFVFTVAFFLVFFAVYFFRPKKQDKIVSQSLERELIDPEELVLPHRAEPNWPATLETGDGTTAEGLITSISHGSGFLKSDTRLEIGERFRLAIHVPDRPVLQLEAEVTWSNMHLPAEKVVKRGMGIRFIEAGAEAASLINDTIARHAAALQGAANPGAQ